MTYRKIGGIHWITIGRARFAFCLKRKAKPSIRLVAKDGNIVREAA